MNQEWLRHWDFIIIDSICLQLALILVCYIRRGIWFPYANHSLGFQAAVLSLCQLGVMPFAGYYFSIVRRSFFQEIWRVLGFAITTTLIALFYFFITKTTDSASRILLASVMGTFVVLDLFGRTLNKKRVLRAKRAQKNRAIILITSSRLVRRTYELLFNANSVKDFTLTQIFTMDPIKPGQFDDMNISVTYLDNDALQEINHTYIDEVLVVQPDDIPMPKEFIDIFMNMGITVNYTNSFMENFTEIHRFGYFDVLTSSVKFASAFDLALKRLFDIICGFFGCIITGILYLFIAPAIKRKSPGPAFFAQERIGKNGKVFKMYKFRSMYLDAEERKAELEKQNKISSGLMFKIDDDPRIIGSEKKDKNGNPKGIGNFIRKTSLDEFPQFFNVLKGDMSLIGTRPPTKDEWNKYSLSHRIRMSTRPGLTGMWQVSGRSKITDFDEIVALDRYYIEHWSLSLDASILFKTAVVLFKREGAV